MPNLHVHPGRVGRLLLDRRQIEVREDDLVLLEGAPRLFGIVADPEDDDHPQVIAWGHELPDQAVLTWRLGNGGSEVAIFSSAEAALATAQLLYPARLLWTAGAGERF
jgi:hypothetical protein